MHASKTTQFGGARRSSGNGAIAEQCCRYACGPIVSGGPGRSQSRPDSDEIADQESGQADDVRKKRPIEHYASLRLAVPGHWLPPLVAFLTLVLRWSPDLSRRTPAPPRIRSRFAERFPFSFMLQIAARRYGGETCGGFAARDGGEGGPGKALVR
jgi:hypothetical protein